MSWTAQPNAAATFAEYCAPTAFAALTGCTPIEAAQTLLDAGLATKNKGAVDTIRWMRFLKDELNLLPVDTIRPLDERERLVWERRVKGGWRSAVDARFDKYGRLRHAPSVYTVTIAYPTVTEWLKAHPTAVGILNTPGHTLAVREGKVVGDTLDTKSARRRVLGAYIVRGTLNPAG